MAEKESKTVDVVAGQYHKFMLIPPTPEETHWFDAGPISFAIEGRVFGNDAGEVFLRGVTLHVFSANHKQEWLRFDSFDQGAHYHYITQPEDNEDPFVGSNTVWGYDAVANGDLIDWAIARIRTRLPTMLRKSGAERLAKEVETSGFDQSVLTKVREAATQAYQRTIPGTDMVRAANDFHRHWKEIHPQFNTVDY